MLQGLLNASCWRKQGAGFREKNTNSGFQNDGGSHNHGGTSKTGDSTLHGPSSDWVYVKGGRDHRERGGAPFGVKTTLGGDRREVGNRDREVRHLSPQETADRRQKGLCFKCGGPFHPRHQCLDQHLRVMVIEEGYNAKGEMNVF